MSKPTTTDYQPIDCGMYDHLEIAIMRRSTVELVYFAGEDREPTTVSTPLTDTRTENKEEFVRLANGEWVRLDRIVSLDGRAFHGSCGLPPQA